MTTPDANTNFNDLGTSFQGTDVYAFSGLGYLNDPDRITLPVVDMMENRSVVKTNLVLSSDNIKKTEVNSVRSLNGAARSYDQSMLMDVYDYLEEEIKQEMVADNAGFTYSTDVAKYQKAYSTYVEKRGEQRDEAYEALLKSESKVDELELNSYKILQTGRDEESPSFTYEVNYSTADFLKKVGPNYLFSLGSLIDQQTKIDKENRERKYDIYMPYARSYAYEISFNIPVGYKVDGLDKLTSSIENATGGFTSRVETKDDIVTIYTHKYYLHNYESSDKWPDMLAFLDAAYEFNQKKLLFKKL
jgi:hypothetical protein